MSEAVRVAAIQQPPVLLDRDATLRKAVAYLGEAASNGARLVVFPEAYVPGFPDWALLSHPIWHRQSRNTIYELLLDNSIDVAAGDLEVLQAEAARQGTIVVVGINERSPESKTSVFNSLVTISSDGSIVNVHRKLIPTNLERTVWSPGDGAGLKVVETEIGRVGGLICFENLMPLARFSLYSQGIDIYTVSTWDEGDEHVASMQHIAREGKCWVVCSGNAFAIEDIPDEFPDREEIYGDYLAMFPDEEWLAAGDSLIVNPSGQVVAGPMRNEYGILYGDIDISDSRGPKWHFDPAGHYNRPDVFDLTVDRRRRTQIEFLDTESRPNGELTPSEKLA